MTPLYRAILVAAITFGASLVGMALQWAVPVDVLTASKGSVGAMVGLITLLLAIFIGGAGAEPPGSQTVLVQDTSNAPVTFHSGRITAGGQNWFTSTPVDATVTEAEPVRIVIQPQTAGLAPGVYRGTLTLSFSDGNTRNVAVVLVLIAEPNGIGAAVSSISDALLRRSQSS